MIGASRSSASVSSEILFVPSYITLLGLTISTEMS
jgi:hypothetical protein